MIERLGVPLSYLLRYDHYTRMCQCTGPTLVHGKSAIIHLTLARVPLRSSDACRQGLFIYRSLTRPCSYQFSIHA